MAKGIPMTKTYKSFEELHADYANTYGEDWDVWGRSCLTEAQEIDWVTSCYDLYERTCTLRDTYCGEYCGDEEFTGLPFEIIGRVPVTDYDYDLCSLPLYFVRCGG